MTMSFNGFNWLEQYSGRDGNVCVGLVTSKLLECVAYCLIARTLMTDKISLFHLFIWRHKCATFNEKPSY